MLSDKEVSFVTSLLLKLLTEGDLLHVVEPILLVSGIHERYHMIILIKVFLKDLT